MTVLLVYGEDETGEVILVSRMDLVDFCVLRY